jgi:tyrosine-protein phosphatase SIW14
MAIFWRWIMGLSIATFIVAAPYIYYRYEYTRYRRFRIVDPGILYRSGTLTASGFREVIKEYGIRTIINVRDDYPEPELDECFFACGSISERKLSQSLGVRYIFLAPDLVDRRKVSAERPKAIDGFLALMDDPANHPVLLHCKAGLHRTGRLTAIYRMEYMGWSPGEALRELRANGYGYIAASEADEFIIQFVENYVPRSQRPHLLPLAPPPHAVRAKLPNDAIDGGER